MQLCSYQIVSVVGGEYRPLLNASTGPPSQCTTPLLMYSVGFIRIYWTKVIQSVLKASFTLSIWMLNNFTFTHVAVQRILPMGCWQILNQIQAIPRCKMEATRSAQLEISSGMLVINRFAKFWVQWSPLNKRMETSLFKDFSLFNNQYAWRVVVVYSLK